MHAQIRLLLFLALTSVSRNALGGDIINGEKAPENSMQYMAYVHNNKGNFCGGFLVSEYFVITAAHCNDWKPTEVILGSHDLRRAVNKKKRSIKSRAIYPGYKSVGNGKDIMLLKLSKKVPLDKTVKLIRLPSSNTNIKDKEKCQVAGWGANHTGGGGVLELRVVDVSIINKRDCKREWPTLPENVICAGGYKTNKGFCQGDSGGPLVCNGKPVGIVSFNNKANCTYPNKPNVYTNVLEYLDWIKDILNRTKHNE